MKKLLLFNFIALFTFSLNAQITINSTNIVDIGDVSYQGIDTIPDVSIVPGSAGTNQTWDFSALIAHDYDTLSFVDPATTPYDADITGDNVATYMTTNNAWAYFNKNTSILEILGFVGDIFGTGTPVAVPFNPSETLLTFPFNYQDTFTDTSSYEIIMDTVKIIQTTYKTVESDAWGSVTIPIGTYNALRIFTTKIEQQDIYFDVFGNWVFFQTQIDTIYTYDWWSDDQAIKLPLISFDWDTVNSIVDGKVEFIESINVSVSEISSNTEISIFPNPSDGIFQVKADNIISVEIININGEIVYNKLSNEITSITTIDISNNPKGIYLVNLRTEKELISKKIILN